MGSHSCFLLITCYKKYVACVRDAFCLLSVLKVACLRMQTISRNSVSGYIVVFSSNKRQTARV